MKGRMNTELGSILIDTDVIATYAGSVAVECFGIVGMATVNMKRWICTAFEKRQLKARNQCHHRGRSKILPGFPCDRSLRRKHPCRSR